MIPKSPIEFHMSLHTEGKYIVKIYYNKNISSISFNDIKKGLKTIKDELHHIEYGQAKGHKKGCNCYLCSIV